jgi:hypothetical protein
MDKLWLTNQELLKKIGDTRGSHIAVEIEPFVDVMRRSSSNVQAGRQLDFFVQYICGVASLVLDVAQKLIREASR